MAIWIAHLRNGKTVNQKTEDFINVTHRDITSMQLLFINEYFTLSKRHDTHRFIQQRFSKVHWFVGRNKISRPVLAGQHILLIYNKKGDAIGWEIDFEKNEAYEVRLNVVKDLRLNLEAFNITLDDIQEGKLPILKRHKMNGNDNTDI